MSNSSFEQLVKNFADRQRQEAAQGAVMWDERKNWWIDQVHQLFDELETWLRPLIQSGSVYSRRPRYPASEEQLGTYNIECLELEVAGKKLTLLPIGTLILGAFGRIDVRGPEGEVSLILGGTDTNLSSQEQRARASWFIRHPSRQVPRSLSDLRPLNESTFQQMFADLFGINP